MEKRPVYKWGIAFIAVVLIGWLSMGYQMIFAGKSVPDEDLVKLISTSVFLVVLSIIMIRIKE